MLTAIFLGAIFFAAGFTQGVSGFGAALVAMPLLTLFLDVKTAAPLCMLNGLLITLFLSLQLQRHIDWAKIRPLFFGCVPGIFLGVWLLKGTESEVLKILLGGLIILYSAYRLTWKTRQRKLKSRWAYLAGFATGVIGGAFSAGGPPAVIYVSLAGWKKDEIKAALSIFFLTTGVIISAVQALNGLVTTTVLAHFAGSFLFTCAGVYSGSRLYNRIKQETYIRIMLLLLMVLGAMMIFTAAI
jgi:hypothetical protein